MFIQLPHQTCNNVNEHTDNTKYEDADRGSKLLIATWWKKRARTRHPQQHYQNPHAQNRDHELTHALEILSGPPDTAEQEQIRKELTELFIDDSAPPVVPPQLQTVFNQEDTDAIQQNIVKVLSHVPKRRGAEPAGEIYEHCGVVNANPHTEEALTKTLMQLATNNVHPNTLNALAAARIIPLVKPNGKFRPIACGRVLRRIIAAAVAKQVTAKVFEHLHHTRMR
jgi:hypothetical protein